MSTQHQGANGDEELERERAAYEEQLSRITSAEMTLQAVISLLSIGGRRLGADGRDLEQVRDAIDAVMALMPILERRMPQELGPLRAALSQLQFAYARESQAAGENAAGGGSAGESQSPGRATPEATSTEQSGEPGAEGEQPGPGEPGRTGPGPAESSGRLWVPGR